jgi:hypothetical protein
VIPDVVQDHVTDCAKRLGYKFTEQVFYRAALEHGFGRNAEDKAKQMQFLWARNGYSSLPDWVRDFILRASNGEYSKGGESISESRMARNEANPLEIA